MDIVKIRKKEKELREKKLGTVEQKKELSTDTGLTPKAEQGTAITERTVNTDFKPEQTVLKDGSQKDTMTMQIVETRIGEQMPEGEAEEFAEPEEIIDESKIAFEMPQIEVLEFVLGDEEYGVLLEDVREIIRMKPITEIPRTPAFVKGILSLRGTMIPVIDLKMRLKLGETQITQMTRIVIISDDTRFFGVIVDKINGVVKIREDMIEPTPPTISADVAEFIKGLGKYGEKMVRLLDLHKVSMFV